MTPRQMAGWLQLAQRRKLGEQAQMLSLLRASQSEQRPFQTLLRKMQDESQ